MKIKIQDQVYLESSSRSFLLKWYGSEHDGERKVKAVRYYSSLEHVFDALMKRKMLDSKAETLQELLTEVRDYRNEIRGLLGLNQNEQADKPNT